MPLKHIDDHLINMQDPNKLDAKVLSEFDHVKHDTKLDDEGEILEPNLYMTL